MNKVYENIKAICKQRRISQESLADKIHISQSYFSLLMNGKRNIDYEVLLHIANILNLSIIELIVYPDKYVKEEEISIVSEPQVEYKVKKKIDNLGDALHEIENLKLQLDYARKLIEEKERTINILQNQLK